MAVRLPDGRLSDLLNLSRARELARRLGTNAPAPPLNEAAE
jgi:hypothetical protein